VSAPQGVPDSAEPSTMNPIGAGSASVPESAANDDNLWYTETTVRR
jgi:hypothetical protein